MKQKLPIIMYVNDFPPLITHYYNILTNIVLLISY